MKVQNFSGVRTNAIKKQIARDCDTLKGYNASRTKSRFKVEIKEIKSRIREAKKELYKREGDSLHCVTDHAIVRFLERVCGVDIEEVRATLEAVVIGRKNDWCNVDIDESSIVVIVNGRAVTVKEKRSEDR